VTSARTVTNKSIHSPINCSVRDDQKYFEN
jgi:hypothetical protein